jgi:hypothetical protein
MKKSEIDSKIDELISDLMHDVGLDNWYYISHRLEFVAENIRKARGIELTEDYVRGCFISFMKNCDKDLKNEDI